MNTPTMTFDYREEAVFTFPRTHYFVAIFLERPKESNLVIQSFTVAGNDPLMREDVITRATQMRKDKT